MPSSAGLPRSLSDVSYDTSAKDPNSLRCRVFVGNLNTTRIGRDEIIALFRNYGTITGCTVFKGYAFMQFIHPPEADLSVNALNGYNWNGSVLDVKLASFGAKSSAVPSAQGQNHFGSTAKKSHDGPGGVKRPAAMSMSGLSVNEQNKKFAANLENVDFESHEFTPDTLVCGECRFVTKLVSNFVEHRKKPCTFFKPEGEPLKLQCFTCKGEFSNSWALLQHLQTLHKMMLFRNAGPATPPMVEPPATQSPPINHGSNGNGGQAEPVDATNIDFTANDVE